MTVIVKCRDSLLTTSSGYTNYRGILNLVIILLVLSNARAALENIIKYGILVDPFSWILFLAEGSKHWPALLTICGLGVHILIAYGIELLLARKPPLVAPSSVWRPFINITLVANLIACISIPPIVVYLCNTHPISTSGSLMIVSIVFLKLVSYHMMNFWCRDLKRPESKQAKTTKSFLRSYIPPAIEFGAIELPSDDPEKSPSVESQPPVATANGSLKKETKQHLRPRVLRQQQVNQDSNNNSKSSKQTNDSIDHNQRATPVKTNGKPASTSGNQDQSTAAGKSAFSPSGRKLSPREMKIREISLDTLAKYPNNINFRNICAFMSYPTLCYEIDYTRTERIRKRFLIKRVCELIVLLQLDMALVQQWIVPTVSNSIMPFRQMQLSNMFERLLKLAIPNHVIWLIWFYMFFHSFLNIIAELTRFADRQFYNDWWNSESVYYFWSNWNIPVHKWCARHLYVPLISIGFNKCQAFTSVFFVSAFFHEYLVSVPLKMFRMWAFTGMLMQLPWARFVSAYFNNYFANVAVWLSLILGQPLCILMYYHDYYVINNNLPSR